MDRMPKWPTRRSKGAADTGDDGGADAHAGGGAARAPGAGWMVKLAVAVIVVVVGAMVLRPARDGAPAGEAGAGQGGKAGDGGAGAKGTRAAKRPADDGKPPLRTTRGEVQAAANEGAAEGAAGAAGENGAAGTSGAAGAGGAAVAPGAAPSGAGGDAPAGGSADAAEKPQPARAMPTPPAHAPAELVDLVAKAMLNRDAIAAAADGGKPADPAAAAEAKRLAGEINDWIAREADNDRRLALIEWVSQAMDPAREPPAPAPGSEP